MSSLLFGIAMSAVLSVTSFIIVLFRVSPLSAPGYALPAFFLSLLLALSSVGALIFYAFWHFVPIHTWDAGKLLAIALRQGIFLALGTCTLILFHLLGVLTWWVAILTYAVFVLVELALDS